MHSTQTNIIKRDAHKLGQRYDVDNDLIPNTPVVTYADMELLDMIMRLVTVVEDLQDQINNLKGEK